MKKKKILFITTIPISFIFFKGQLSYLKKRFDIEIVSSSGEFLEEIAKSEKVKKNIVEIKREISILNDIISLFNLIKLFFKKKPDLIHGSTPKAGLLSMLAGWITHIPIRVYYVHGLRYQGSTGFKKKVLILMEKLSCLFATHIISVSNGVKNQMINDKITMKKILVIGNGSVNGIDLKYFNRKNKNIPKIEKDIDFSGSSFIFGYVGRLVRDKGINELITAFVQINKEYSNTKLLLVGNFEKDINPINSEIKKEINRNKNIIHVGFQKDIRPFLKIMNVFIFPSYREGFGVSLIEALAMEIPSVSSDIIGCNEIIKHYENGLLIQPGSVSQLKKSMLALLTDKQLFQKLKSNSRKYIQEKYDQKKVWEETLNTLENLSNI